MGQTSEMAKKTWVDGSGTKNTKKFQYPEVVGNHFMYRHSVDDHNNKTHSPISLEVIWATNVVRNQQVRLN